MFQVIILHSPIVNQDDWFYAELVASHLEYGDGRVQRACAGPWGFVMQVVQKDWGLESFGLRESAVVRALKGE